jgi:hypothetical protein
VSASHHQAIIARRAFGVQDARNGCDIDWHSIDQSTAEVGLDDYVYTMKKQ